MAMSQLPVGVDIKLSQPKKLSRPKFNFKMGVYLRGGLFRGFFSVGVYFLSNVNWGVFPGVGRGGGLFPRPELIIYEKNNNQKSLIKINFMLILAVSYRSGLYCQLEKTEQSFDFCSVFDFCYKRVFEMLI